MSKVPPCSSHKHPIGLFIGRFQPLHLGHLHIIEEALTNYCEHLYIILGSAGLPRTPKNPWTTDERTLLIQNNLDEFDHAHNTHHKDNVSICPVIDLPHDDLLWAQSVIGLFADCVDSDVVLIGHDKDDSTFYLRSFPKWQRIELDCFHDYDGTKIRQAYFEGHCMTSRDDISPSTQDFLEKFRHTQQYLDVKSEYDFMVSHQKSWSQTPHPVIFNTVDSVVICQNKVLLIQRKNHPGRGLWALPGGYLEPSESIATGIVRELTEETQIDLTQEILKQSLQAVKAFDTPGRSIIARNITHAGYFPLELASPPQVQANDDAQDCLWYDLNALHELTDKMHDDHYHIIQHFVNLKKPT